ncbi:aminopeptidase I zinc metalloprotease [Cooperia oncophora]
MDSKFLPPILTSPCLKVKPISKIQSEGYNLVGAMTYARSLWHTWFDRDLSVAGEVVCRVGDELVRRLIDLMQPVLYLPSLSVHLMDSNPVCYNEEDDFRLLFEKIGGIRKEFLTGGRLDDLVGTYTAIQALIKSCENERCLESEKGVRIVACFDSENVSSARTLKEPGRVPKKAVQTGSTTEMGAKSAFFEHILRRVSTDSDPVAFERACGRSMLVTVNQFDATHPNYPDKSEGTAGAGENDPRSIMHQHHLDFLKLIARAADTTPEEIVDMDLYVYDTTKTMKGQR